MSNPKTQAMARTAYRTKSVEVTNTLCTPIDVTALMGFLDTSHADIRPPIRRGAPNKLSYRDMINNFLPQVHREPGARYGWVKVDYHYGKMGRALADAGLIASARDIAIPAHWQRDPFACLKRELRSLALGYGFDIDDNAAHPNAKQAMVPVGRDSGRIFLANRDTIMRAQAAQLFPTLSQKDGRDRIKQLYNSLNMDGSFGEWASKWAIPENMNKAELNVGGLAGGETFRFATYLQDLSEGTGWLAQRLEKHTGMLSFIAAHHKTHRPTYRTPERTLKSFALSEAESFSRDAKVEWCAQQRMAVCSLQHDGGIIVTHHTTAQEAHRSRLPVP